MAQQSQGTVGTLVDQSAHGAMGFGIETEHLVEDIVVGMVETAHVAQGIIYMCIGVGTLPVSVPQLRHGHADKHNPTQGNGGIGVELADAVGHIVLAHLAPCLLYIGTLGHGHVYLLSACQIGKQVFSHSLFKIHILYYCFIVNLV